MAVCESFRDEFYLRIAFCKIAQVPFSKVLPSTCAASAYVAESKCYTLELPNASLHLENKCGRKKDKGVPRDVAQGMGIRRQLRMRFEVILTLAGFLEVSAQLGIWPQPQSYTCDGAYALAIDAGAFTFNASGVQSPILNRALLRYKQITFLAVPALVPLSGTDAGTLTSLTVNVLTDDESLDINTTENYTLTIPHSGGVATLIAPSVFGAIRGLETFSQLVSWAGPAPTSFKVGVCSVLDFPRFPFRSAMIDSSRHFVPLPTFFAFIDAMASSKLNVLHWHVTDDQVGSSSRREPRNVLHPALSKCSRFRLHRLPFPPSLPGGRGGLPAPTAADPRWRCCTPTKLQTLRLSSRMPGTEESACSPNSTHLVRRQKELHLLWYTALRLSPTRRLRTHAKLGCRHAWIADCVLHRWEA